ncbi:murein biosynthesis integral membrane protein MurJ [Corynebacterium yudongzhengii]|uniref:Murein biosynthesis integral membrane protein MurJ n=1 Tax=Corynebacterium yudongzhengii TaxID=2080740 RepID=A0A2U1T4J6_9CORY|nr:murein biosynthesis integral membrane protein MurJ [Corynebacterium yudongzhengii]AWB82876.1 murein biosynthesis integral membrane protein MurJ [Corynebacterium yudongzhengii]PWC00929.1 murein biosynthesis integral membrane protein MurJ [Corynebacterium yudongzhengii]
MTEDFHPRSAGLRARHVRPSPPAPVPTPRPVPTPARNTQEEDRSGLTLAPGETAATASASTAASATATATAAPADEAAQKASDTDVVRSTGSMAIATILSRITGFIRTALIGGALGVAVADAFNTANTLPNLITEIVLGSVLTALVVPVLVRAEREDADRGAEFIRRLFTLTFALVTVVTVIAVLGAPLLTRLMLESDGEVNVYMSTSFAILVLPQIFFYGLFSLFMAILNTKGIFKPGAWAPVANNLISIAVLMTYMAVPGMLDPSDQAPVWDPHVLLLGLGTTLGVVVQCGIMIMPLRRAGVDLRPLWGIDDRLKQFGGMALAIIVYVAISQLGFIINNRIASDSAVGAITIYQYHWLLLQVPYGVIGVTLLTAIMPRLSRNAADGDDRAVVNDLTMATKLTFIALVPIIVFFTGFGTEISHALFQFRNFDEESADLLGLTLSFSAFTLIPYALVMLHLRVFYAREQAWTPTWIIAGITFTKVLLAYLAPYVASSPAHVVILLGAANGFGFVTGAAIGALLLRAKLGSLGLATIMRTTMWAMAASLVGLAAAMLTRFLLNNLLGGLFVLLGTIGQLVVIGIMGVVFLIVTGLVLSRSGLAEVHNIGQMFTRVPILGLFINVDEDKALEVGAVDEVDMSSQIASYDAFNASPTPPPMSAGVVRGPKLVPGAPVSDGRFRLLHAAGTAYGSRFWKAREVATGEDVALTFVDTSGQAPLAPRTPAESARTAAEVAKRTRWLAELDHPGIADNIRILSYRSGCLIVADWVEGSSLRAIVDASNDEDLDVTLNSRAVALALAPLAEAAAEAETAGTPLGLDNSSRIRITTDGRAVLAFPGVLPQASAAQDGESLAAAINLLSEATASGGADVDSVLAQIAYDAHAVAGEIGENDVCLPSSSNELTANEKIRDLASRLREFGLGPDAEADAKPEESEAIANAAVAARGRADEQMPDADLEGEEHGFGSSGYSTKAIAFILGAVATLVLLVAAATTILTSLIAGNSDTAPVNPESIQGESATSTPRQLPIIVHPDAAGTWQAPGQDPAADNPDLAGTVIDDNRETAWRTDDYPNGLGTKAGVGLATVREEPMYLERVRLDSPSQGARYSVYLLREGEDPAVLTDLTELERAATGEIGPGRETIEIDSESADPVAGVLIWFTDMPENDDHIEVREVELIGQTVRG